MEKSNFRFTSFYAVALRSVGKRLIDCTPLRADIGCDDGVFVYQSMRRKLRIVGFDLAIDSLASAKQGLALRNLKSPSLACTNGYASAERLLLQVG